MNMKALVIDVNKCNGCYNCHIASKDEHVGNDWTPYAKPQPDTGEKDGYSPKEIKAIGTEKDVNIGHIPLEKRK
jgi:Fe-S-cluster-containing dehydrogenase component